MSILRAVAQPLLVAPFIVSGADALARPGAHRGRAQRLTPVALKFGIELDETTSDSAIHSLGAVSAVAEVALAAGKLPRAADAIPTAAQAPVALANNSAWSGKGKDRKGRFTELTGLLGAVGLVGGALLAATDRDGKPSLSWRRQTSRRHKEALKAARASQAQ